MKRETQPQPGDDHVLPRYLIARLGETLRRLRVRLHVFERSVRPDEEPTQEGTLFEFDTPPHGTLDVTLPAQEIDDTVRNSPGSIFLNPPVEE